MKQEIINAYNQGKKEHPECIVLVRFNGSYFSLRDDARKMQQIAGGHLLHATEHGMMPYHAFGAYSLDTRLPKIIRNGNKVLISDIL